MTQYNWPSMFVYRKEWRRRKWNDSYWINYGFPDLKRTPYGKWLWISHPVDPSCHDLLAARKKWNIDYMDNRNRKMHSRWPNDIR